MSDDLRGLVSGLALAVAVSACATVDTSRSFALPVTLGSPLTCAGVGTEAVLDGSPDDRHITWIVSPLGGKKPVLWPPGWTAQFNPDLQVFDPQGRKRYEAGYYVSGYCMAQTADGEPAAMLDNVGIGPGNSSGPD